MKVFATLVILPALTLATESTLSWDNNYDDSGKSTNVVACSAQLKHHGFHTLGDLPNFPNIGGAPAVTGSDSSNCGTCWKVTYTNKDGDKKTIKVLAIDVGTKGFNVAKAAMNHLTDGEANRLGRVDVSYSKTSSSDCGL